MFPWHFFGIDFVRLVQAICLAISGWTGISGTAIAQYGFTSTNSPGLAPGSEWGNYYLGTAIQPAAWNRYPSYPGLGGGYQPPQQLGVYMQNTPSGVIIGQVASGSIAEKAGLKNGDLIISVAGVQVGFVNNRIVDLMETIHSNLDFYGRVNALVQDGSTRLVKSLVLDFSPHNNTIATAGGQVSFEGGFSIYRSGTIKVDLVNLTRPYLTASGGNTYIQVSGSGPFAFSIPYDTTICSPTDQYRLTATYFDSNRQMISTSSLDIGGLNPTAPATYSLRLYANPNVGSYTSAYGAYSSNPNMINDIFRQYLGREPSISEAQAWTQTISSMHPSEKDIRADILATPAFYDRAGNDQVLFIKQMIESNTRSPATYDQIQYWSARLGFYGGNRLLLTREYVYSF